MTHLEYITVSKNWSCPKSGIWKIICVGGGASGGFYGGDYVEVPHQSEGGTTSFGNYISAPGGAKPDKVVYSGGSETVGGYGGYDLFQYGGNPGLSDSTLSSGIRVSPTLNGGLPISPYQGHGYGAGGGSGKLENITCQRDSGEIGFPPKNYPGLMGEIKTTILDLTANTTIACTIGKGGLVKDCVTPSEILAAAKSHLSGITSLNDSTSAIAMLKSRISDGKDGVIIVEYLGE